MITFYYRTNKWHISQSQSFPAHLPPHILKPKYPPNLEPSTSL